MRKELKNEARPKVIILNNTINENFSIDTIINEFWSDKTKYYQENHLFISDLKDKLSKPEDIMVYKSVSPVVVQLEENDPEAEPKIVEPVSEPWYDIKICNEKLQKVDRVRSLQEVFENNIINEYPSLYLII